MLLLPIDITVVKDVRVVVRRVYTNKTKQEAADTDDNQPNSESLGHCRCYKAHHGRKDERYKIPYLNFSR